MAYYNQEAYALAQWAREENNRIKASHIARVADRLEQRYIKHYECEELIPYGIRPPRGVGSLSLPPGPPPPPMPPR